MQLTQEEHNRKNEEKQKGEERMSYDRTRVDLTEVQHNVAKEWNDLIEAMIDDDGDKVKEAIEAVMVTFTNLAPTKRERLQLVMKVILANVSDELQQRILAPPEPE